MADPLGEAGEGGVQEEIDSAAAEPRLQDHAPEPGRFDGIVMDAAGGCGYPAGVPAAWTWTGNHDGENKETP